MKRQSRQSQQADGGPMGLLAGLGLLNDPMQELGGFVNLLNELQKPQQVDQELAMRQQAQDNQASQFAQSLAQQQAGLDARQQGEAEQANQWFQEYTLRKQLAADNKIQEGEQMAAQKSNAERAGFMGLFGNLLDYQSRGNNVNFGAIKPQMEKYGLENLFTSAPKADDPLAGKIKTKEQELQLQKRRAKGL